jgi:hypothetical protein
VRIVSATVLCFASLLANPYIEPDPGNIGIGALEFWPTARSTALAGAMTGLADEADATYFNPAGLAFQTSAGANVDFGEWLPGLVPGMSYVTAAGGAPLRLRPLHSHHVYVSGSLVYLTMGRGTHSYLWRGYAAAQLAILLTNRLGAGIGLKVAHSTYSVSWLEGEFEKGTAGAADVALLYRPMSRVSIGAALDNLGPRIVYSPSRDTAELPRLVRLGACWTPIDSRLVRLHVMPELTEVLVRIPADTAVRSIWKDVWKALGVEATVFNLVSLRLSYFEDLTNRRGGFIYQGAWGTEHCGLWDVITRKDRGRLDRIGICWGFGIGYKDYFRVDVSSDAAIYDFTTKNWKFSLVANDIAGGIRELRKGHEPWKE